MLDHVLVDVITLVRRSLEDALLQRQALEERFQVDVFLGDVSWETSYSLPGEARPRGCGPTSRWTGPPGARAPTARGPSASRPTTGPSSWSRSPCASSA